MGIVNFNLHVDKLAELLKRIVYPRDLPKLPVSQQANTVDVRVLAALHYSAIHGIRRFAVKGHLLRPDRLVEDAEAFQSLANECRNAMASAIQQEWNSLHCTIKLCKGTPALPKADWVIWTLARSEASTSYPATLRGEFGPDAGQKAKENSAYAALIGCSDGKTEWGTRVYPCFCCNDLTKYDEYVNTRENWRDYYRAGIVFPLRWIKEPEPEINIKGFLTFDSILTDVFTRAPCIFEFKNDLKGYRKQLICCPTYHVGGIIADVLATAIALEDTSEK